MRKSYKYRIYPTTSQISQLENTFSMCRHLYNWNLAERKQIYKETGKSVSYYDQQNALPDLKEERPWFKSIHSQVLQDVLKRLDNSYKSFFRRVKSGEKPGFPKFKKRGQWNSITYPQYRMFPLENRIKVPKLGSIKIVYHRLMLESAKIKTLSITKEAGKWFACFSLELDTQCELKHDLNNAVGIDLGLIDFFYPSTGGPVSVPKYLRKSEKHLQKMQRKLLERTKMGQKQSVKNSIKLSYQTKKCAN